jgi:hypothetical protein
VSALRALLAGIVDYAGLFPPAGLSMEATVQEYAQRRGSAEGFMLGRFVVNASRFEEMARAGDAWLPKQTSRDPWRIAALLSEDFETDFREIARFNDVQSGRAVVDTVEGRAARPEDLERLTNAVPPGFNVYVEVPLDPDPSPMLGALAGRGVRAKARTGGLTAAAVPSPARLARFLAACSGLGLPFKATAGLHHAVRSEQPFTDAAAGPRGVMHGFLNVFAAAALLRAGRIDEAGAAALLEEERKAAFVFQDDVLRVAGTALDHEELAATRSTFATSFGSCSFADPVRDLREMGLLSGAPALSR